MPADSMTRTTSWSIWAYYICLTILTLVFFIGASVIVLSLIPLYLPNAGSNISKSQVSNSLLWGYYSNWRRATGQSTTVTNTYQIARQLEAFYNLPAGSLVVTTANLYDGAASSGRRRRHLLQKKRRDASYCDITAISGTAVQIKANIVLSSICGTTKSCTNKKLKDIETKVLSANKAPTILFAFADGSSASITLIPCKLQATLTTQTTTTTMTTTTTTTTTTTAPMGPCILPGTPIVLSDGTTTVPIEKLHVGEKILGIGGEINKVLAVHFHTVDGRTMYGLNGLTPFITPDHPFISPKNHNVQLVFDANASRAVFYDIPPETFQQIEIGTQLIHYDSVNQRFENVSVKSISKDDSMHPDTKVYYLLTDSTSGVLGAVANDYLTGNEWYDFRYYSASIIYDVSIAKPVIESLPSRYATYIKRTGSNLSQTQYNGMVALAIAQYAKAALINHAGAEYPPTTTTKYQMAWKTLAVSLEQPFENSPSLSGFYESYKRNLVYASKWLNNLDPSATGFPILQSAVDDTLSWWSTNTQF